MGGASRADPHVHRRAATLKALEQYLRESLTGEFLIDREPSTPEYQLAQTLKGSTRLDAVMTPSADSGSTSLTDASSARVPSH